MTQKFNASTLHKKIIYLLLEGSRKIMNNHRQGFFNKKPSSKSNLIGSVKAAQSSNICSHHFYIHLIIYVFVALYFLFLETNTLFSSFCCLLTKEKLLVYYVFYNYIKLRPNAYLFSFYFSNVHVYVTYRYVGFIIYLFRL